MKDEDRPLEDVTMSRRQMIIGAVAFVLALILALILQPWQYFVVNEVDEAFPGLSSQQRDAVRGMPEAQKDMLLKMAQENRDMAEAVAIAQGGADVVVPPDQGAMPTEMPPQPVALAAGSFIDIDPIHGAVGSATIYELPGGGYILRFEDFRSKNGPDLHVYLSTEVPTTTFGSLGTGAVHLGSLKGNVGNQNYQIPADLDLSAFRSVVIYCKPFRVIFSTAALS